MNANTYKDTKNPLRTIAAMLFTLGLAPQLKDDHVEIVGGWRVKPKSLAGVATVFSATKRYGGTGPVTRVVAVTPFDLMALTQARDRVCA